MSEVPSVVCFCTDLGLSSLIFHGSHRLRQGEIWRTSFKDQFLLSDTGLRRPTAETVCHGVCSKSNEADWGQWLAV